MTPSPGRSPGATARFRHLLSALVLYAVLVTFLTWPLVPGAARELPDTARACRFDSLLVTWALAHQSRAIVSAPEQYFEAGIYHPTPSALLYGEAAFGGLPYFFPVFAASGNPTLAINFTFIVSVILAAFALHYVLFTWTGSFLGGFVAGWTFLMTRWVLWSWAPCAPNYAILVYFPLVILLAERPVRRLTDSLRLGGLVFLQGLSSVYVAASVLAPLALLGLGRWIARRGHEHGGRLFVTTLFAALALAAVYGSYLIVSPANPELSRQSVWAFFSPVTRLPWAFFERSRPTAIPVAALALIAAGTVAFLLGRGTPGHGDRRRHWGHAAFWFAMGVVLSLDPVVRWGEQTIWLPQRVLELTTPLYDIIRLPYRLGIGALVGGSLLAGLAFVELSRRAPARTVAQRAFAGVLLLIFAGGMYAEYAWGFGAPPVRGLRALPRSYPRQPAVDGSSPLVPILRETKGALLEFPIRMANERPASPPQTRAMYRSIFHRRPLVMGYSGYWPAGYLDTVDLARRVPDPVAVETLRREAGLGTILLHVPTLSASEKGRWMPIVEAGGSPSLRLLGRDEAGSILFAVGPPADEPGSSSGTPAADRRAPAG